MWSADMGSLGGILGRRDGGRWRRDWATRNWTPPTSMLAQSYPLGITTLNQPCRLSFSSPTSRGRLDRSSSLLVSHRPQSSAFT